MELRRYRHQPAQDNKLSVNSTITIIKQQNKNDTDPVKKEDKVNVSNYQNKSNTLQITNNKTTHLDQKPQIFSLTQNLPNIPKINIQQFHPFILIGLCVAAGIIIIIVAIICWRKYNTRRLYEQSPQNFSSRPKLSFWQNLKYEREIIKCLTKQQGQVIEFKQTYEGKFIEVTFKTHNNCIYFDNKLTKNCYFQVEIIKLGSQIQIGFVHKEDLKLLSKKNETTSDNQLSFDQYGITVKTDGSVMVYNQSNIFFPWKLEYGDTIGIGITYHENTKTQRVWITKNGVIQNPPSQQQALKQIQVNDEQGNQKTAANKKNNDQQQVIDQQIAKKNALAAKQKIQLKPRSFNYYGVIVSQAPLKPTRDTIINWNIGALNFRLNEQNLKGLLG